VIGSRISAYKILSELGSGGMGAVYLGQVVEAVAGLEEHAKVALKVIHPNLLGQPGFFKRFLREAQIGQEVHHENVVRTYDCDATIVDGNQHNFLVMEYVEGQTLRDLLTELEQVPEELCRHIGREVAKGLAAIHGAGVVHRDIKPENVLITDEHVVKVMDLGVARLQDEAIRLSQAGTFVGSLEYAAPEQFRSADGEADGRADLHSLGVVLYELATGQHPYRDEDASKVLRNILEKQPRKVGEVNPQLSPFFEEVVATLIAKDRDARFASAAMLAAVLEEGESGLWWKDRARALRIETKRPLRRIRVPRETALYGRDENLAKLHTLFDKAKAGEGQVVLVEGEAGIGKTRLVDEFVGRLRQDGEEINFLFGSYPPGGAATSAGAFSEAYREQFGEAGLVDSLEGYLTTTPLLIPAFAALLRGDATPTGTERLTKDSLQTVFVHATRGLAAERTTIVLIDDLHFAPQDGRALFASLAMALPGHRVLLVGTSRPGLSRDWVADLDRCGHFSRMALSRLGPKDLVALLKDAFRSERLADQLAAQVGVKSDGNPFFAFEIIQGLREGQFISEQVDGTWASTQVIKNIGIPSSVEDLIQARMSGLDDDERNLLDVASCCGFEFDPLLVASVLGLAQVPAMQRLARVEKRHRLVRSAGRRYVFDHHQVQESLYAGMPVLLREPYHAGIASALEMRENAADRDPKLLDGQVCVDLCEHFLKGARGESAMRYLEAALDHLDEGYLNDQMIALADRALQVQGLLKGKARVDLLLWKNVRLGRLGKPDAQEATLSEARTLAEEEGGLASLAQVDLAVATLLLHTGRYEASLVHCERARALYAELGDRKGEADAMNGAGNAFRWLSRYGEGRAQHEQALAIRREIGDHDGEAVSTGNLGNLCYLLGQYDMAWAHFERALELAREAKNPYIEAIGTENLGNVLAAQGRHVEARVQLERAIGISREIGSRSTEALTTGNLASAFAAEGRSQEALVQCRRALSLAQEMGDRSSEAYSLMIEGGTLARLGSWDEAQACQLSALDIMREIGLRVLEASTLAALACRLEERGDLEAAAGLREEVLAYYQAVGSHAGDASAAHLDYGVLLARLERTDEARSHLEKALAVATESGTPSECVRSLVHLALLDGGDPGRAVEALRKGADCMEHGMRKEAGFLLYKATGDKQHLEAAHDLLTFWVEHAPEAYRETTLANVKLHRDIVRAWEEHQAAS
jgi:serine/threonine protein kinase/tetratricopeptide (TPR) repeat protein